jgi:mRNA interferase RelE/StbE
MEWRVEFDPAAERELRRLDPPETRRILRFLFDRVAGSADPRRIGAALKRSTLGEFWKYPVGDYRIIARIEDKEVRVLVVRIGHRRAIYR